MYKQILSAIKSFFLVALFLWGIILVAIFFSLVMSVLFTWKLDTFIEAINALTISDFRIANGIITIFAFFGFLATLSDDKKYYK